MRRVASLGLAALCVTAAACGGLASRLSSHVVAENILLEIADPTGANRVTTITSNLADISGPLNNPQVTPIDGATVELDVGAPPTAVQAVPVPGQGGGIYEAISGSGGAPTFVYASNQTYSVSMVIASGSDAGTYKTTGTAPPRATVSGIPDPLQGQTQTVGNPLTITISGAKYDAALVLVFDQGGNLVYDNRPKTVGDAVNLALGNFNGTVQVPGTAFANANQVYGIVVAGLKSAQPSGVTSNLEILSRFYMGSATTAALQTGP